MEKTPPGRTPNSPQAEHPRRRLIGSLALLLALLLLVWFARYLINRNGEDAPSGFGGMGGRPASTVGVAKVDTADIPVELEALGTVQSPATVTVRPQVSGVIQKIAFSEGQTVKAGELLALIDPRPFAAALASAEGALARDQAQLEVARKQLARYQTLIAQDSIAQQDVDTQAATTQQLEGTVAADRAAVTSARLDLGYTRVTAPVSGRVGLRVIDAGNYIAAGDASGIVVITQLKPIDVSFSVPQDRVPELLALGRGKPLPAQALDRTRSQVLAQGQFLTLDNQVDTTTGTVRAKARFANEDEALFPSQFVNLRLRLETLQQVLVVPLTAVRNGADGDYVYVLNAAEHTVSMRKVQRGAQTDAFVQITQGLQAGEQVITEGADRLKDGAEVQLQGEQPARNGRSDADKPGASERRNRHRKRGSGDAAGAGAPPGPPAH